MNIYNEKYLKADYYEDKECIFAVWKGFTSSKDWRKYHHLLINFLKNNKVSKILSDTKDHTLVPKKDIDWAVDYVTPILIENGLKYLAMIIPDDDFGKMTTDTYVNKAKNLFNVKYFDNLKKAKDWIFNIE